MMYRFRWQNIRLYNSLTMTNYRYRDYKQGAVDVSGRKVPGVAPVTNVSGVDFQTKSGLYLNANFQFLTPFALDDANTVKAMPTRILGRNPGLPQNAWQGNCEDPASGRCLLQRR